MSATRVEYQTSERVVTAVINNFIIDRQARGLSANTIRFYRDELGLWTRYLAGKGILEISAVDPDLLRAYFADLAGRRNKGGVHTSFRAIKAFLNWWEIENDGDYTNPIHKVKVPAAKLQPLPGIPISDIQRMINVCTTGLGVRDQAILRLLLDTGARAFEFLALNIRDVDIATGAIRIRRGKGDKERTVHIGSHSRRALRRYLRTRPVYPSAPLWMTDEEGRMSKRALQSMVERRAKDAGVTPPGLHDFRRAFALNMWRNGVDILAISRLLGHSSLEITRRYIAQFDTDLRSAHAKGSPVDNAGL